ncbi:hypothetical protein D3C81_1814450 [compost metagenome]
MLVRQHSTEHILRTVGILIFIDMNVLELLLIEIEHFWNGFEQFNRLHNEIIEIQ